MRNLRYLKHQDKLWMQDASGVQGAGGSGGQGAGVKKKTINFLSLPSNKKLFKIVPGNISDQAFITTFINNVELVGLIRPITKDILAKAVHNSKKKKDHTELNHIRNLSNLSNTNLDFFKQISKYDTKMLNEEYIKIERELIDFDRETHDEIVKESKNLKLHDKINKGESVKTKDLKKETRGVDAINKDAIPKRTRLSAKLALIRHIQYFGLDESKRGSESEKKIIEDMNKHLGSIQDPKGLRGSYLIGQTANKISTTQLEALRDMAETVETELKGKLSTLTDNDEKKKIAEKITNISNTYNAFAKKIIAIQASGNNEADMDFSLLMQIDELRKDQEMFNKEQQKIMEECSSLTGDTYVTTGALWKLIKKLTEEAKKKRQTKIFVKFLGGVKIGEEDVTEAIISYKEGIEAHFTRQLSDGRTVSMELGDYNSYADWEKNTKSNKYSNKINAFDKSQANAFTFQVYKVIEKGNEAITVLQHEYKGYLNTSGIQILNNLKVFDYTELMNAAKKDRFSLSNTNARENITNQITENQVQLANLDDIRTAIDQDIATKTNTFETTEQAYNTASRTLESKKGDFTRASTELKTKETELETKQKALESSKTKANSAWAEMQATNTEYNDAEQAIQEASEKAKAANPEAKEYNQEAHAAAQARLTEAGERRTQAKAANPEAKESNQEAHAAAQARLTEAGERRTQAEADYIAATIAHNKAKHAHHTAKFGRDTAKRDHENAQTARDTAQADHTAAKEAHTEAKKGLDVAKGAKNAVENCHEAFNGKAAKNATDGLNKGQPIKPEILTKEGQKIGKKQIKNIKSANNDISSRSVKAKGNGASPEQASKSNGNGASPEQASKSNGNGATPAP